MDDSKTSGGPMAGAGTDNSTDPGLLDALAALDEAVRHVSILRRQLRGGLDEVERAVEEALGAVHAARRAFDP